MGILTTDPGHLALIGTSCTLIVSGSIYVVPSQETLLKSYYWYNFQHYSDINNFKFLMLVRSFSIVGMIIGSTLFNKV